MSFRNLSSTMSFVLGEIMVWVVNGVQPEMQTGADSRYRCTPCAPHVAAQSPVAIVYARPEGPEAHWVQLAHWAKRKDPLAPRARRGIYIKHAIIAHLKRWRQKLKR